MTTDQFYFLVLVILSFSTFLVALSVNYARYRRWLAKQPAMRDDVGVGSIAHGD